MTCQWCEGPIPSGSRSDTLYCSQSHRQAAWRFRRPGRTSRYVAGHRHHTTPLKLAYADPPYPGTAERYYKDHPDYAGEVDHQELIDRLIDDYPDGWALSTSAEALPEILKMIYTPVPPRVAAWFRGERPTKSYWPLTSWEPVVYYGGRPHLLSVDERRIDSLVHVARARRTDPRRTIGTKPAAFCYWMFELLGAQPGDTLDDLYPGSGGVARAWEMFTMATDDASSSDRQPTDQLALNLGGETR